MGRPRGQPLTESHRRNISLAVQANWNQRRYPHWVLAEKIVAIVKTNEPTMATWLINKILVDFKGDFNGKT